MAVRTGIAPQHLETCDLDVFRAMVELLDKRKRRNR